MAAAFSWAFRALDMKSMNLDGDNISEVCASALDKNGCTPRHGQHQ